MNNTNTKKKLIYFLKFNATCSIDRITKFGCNLIAGERLVSTMIL